MTADETTEASSTAILEREPESLQPHMASNSTLVAKTLDRPSHGLLTRLFPGDVDRIVQGHELAQLQTGFEYRRRALQMAVETNPFKAWPSSHGNTSVAISNCGS